MDIDVGYRVDLPLPEFDLVRRGTVVMLLPEGECLVWWDHTALTVVDASLPEVSFHPAQDEQHSLRGASSTLR